MSDGVSLSFWARQLNTPISFGILNLFVKLHHHEAVKSHKKPKTSGKGKKEAPVFKYVLKIAKRK